jgi:hypothetical protein
MLHVYCQSQYIENQEHLKESIERLDLPPKQKIIELPVDIAKSIEPYAVSLAVEHSKYQKFYGFRYQRQLQTFTKSLAMLEGKKKVDIACIRELERLLEFINFEFTKL